MFGGGDRMTGVVRGDLWRWNGTTWTQLTPAGAGPAARQGAGVVFDPIRQQAVLLGGADQNDVPFGDAWTFDGAVWSQMANTPPNRSYHAMAWDAASQRVVAHGGTGIGTFGPTLRDDTWAWDGTARWHGGGGDDERGLDGAPVRAGAPTAQALGDLPRRVGAGVGSAAEGGAAADGGG